ncbi:MAG: AbrB family transcriptional regulator [Chitinivibrionales bacterium]
MKPKLVWWAIVGAVAVALGLAARRLSIPGAWFVATMIVAVVAGLLRPGHPRVSKPFLMGAQAIIGTMLGISIRPDVFPHLLPHLPEIIGVIVFTIAISLTAGMILPRISSLSRETAAMGSLPGGASAMIALSIGTKADTGIVALMQYLRLVLVVLTASLVARFLAHHAPAASGFFPGQSSASPHAWYDYALMPIVIVGGVWGGRLIRLPTANLLGPMFIGLVISVFHLFRPVLPMWVPPFAYIIMGFYVGLLFDRQSLVKAGRLLPLLIINALVLIALCACAGLAFSWLIGAAPLSGYLATSPGGGDTISIIAFGCGADVSLIFSVQIFRAVVILFTGPYLARAILHISREQSAHESMDNELT